MHSGGKSKPTTYGWSFRGHGLCLWPRPLDMGAMWGVGGLMQKSHLEDVNRTVPFCVAPTPMGIYLAGGEERLSHSFATLFQC